jgi:GDP-4-dehydro-6-deoxy-D-mannose reductase
VYPRHILITGAAGFVGRHLIAELRHQFPNATITPTAQHAMPGFIAMDVTDAHAVAEVIRTATPDVIIHLAAVAALSVARRDPDLAWQVNLHGTLAVARAIEKYAAGCTLLFVSSADIYGLSFQSGHPLDENALPRPANIYAATKAAADLALGALAAEGARVFRLRAFNHTAPGQSADFVVPALARQIARIKLGRQPPVLRVGALEPRRDFLDARDVCACYAACLRHADRLANGEILNIASGLSRRIGDVLDMLLSIAGVRADIETADVLLRPTDIAIASGDASRARTLLEWRPRITWETTLQDVFRDWVARESGEN